MASNMPVRSSSTSAGSIAAMGLPPRRFAVVSGARWSAMRPASNDRRAVTCSNAASASGVPSPSRKQATAGGPSLGKRSAWASHSGD